MVSFTLGWPLESLGDLHNSPKLIKTMSSRDGMFDDYMGHELEDLIPNVEEEFPIHFFSGISKPRFEDDDDFWYGDPYFNEICAEECAHFEEEQETRIEEQERGFLHLETAPLRHLRTKRAQRRSRRS